MKCVEQKERLVSIMGRRSLAISAEPSPGKTRHEIKLFTITEKKCNFICEGRRLKSNFKTEKFSLIIPGECQREREIQFARSVGNALLTYLRVDFALGVVYRNV